MWGDWVAELGIHRVPQAAGAPYLGYMDATVVVNEDLTDLVRVFRDREHAGAMLSQLLGSFRNSDAVVLGIAAGGVPVAAEVARRLDLPVDVAVVSKITLPRHSEAGYGAVASTDPSSSTKASSSVSD